MKKIYQMISVRQIVLLIQITRTLIDVFKKHFIFPTRILERERRKENVHVKAMEVREIGKNSRRAFFWSNS